MDDAEFDRLIARAANPKLIPGIYNYCDRCCDRCRFRERCLSHLEETLQDDDDARAAPIGGDAGGGAAALRPLTRSLERTIGMISIIAKRRGIELSHTPEEDAAFQQTRRALEARAHADRTVGLAREYALTAAPITRALWPIVMERGDESVAAALETIDRLRTSVAAKVYRAVSGALEEDYDPADLQSDPNGSAKVARLFTADSRAAWRVLMETGRATANGVPAKLVAVLDEIDAGLRARFPRAMAFVRPGFDTEPDVAPAAASE